MAARVMLAASIAVALFAALLTGQVKPDQAIHAARVSGRLIGQTGMPIAGRTITFSLETKESYPVTTDETGAFSFTVSGPVVYRIWLTATANPLSYADVGTVEIADGTDLMLGDIILEHTAAGKPWIAFAGPARPAHPPKAPSPGAYSAKVLHAITIAALYITCPAPPETSNDECPGGELHIIQSDGKQFQPQAQPDQVGISSPMISEDRTAVGWLVDHDNCCTSYSLSLQLGVYTPGKLERTFKGDDRAIFGWHFVTGGKQVAFVQEYPHGSPVVHFELRDVGTGRLMGKWDEGDSVAIPSWAIGLETG